MHFVSWGEKTGKSLADQLTCWYYRVRPQISGVKFFWHGKIHQ